MRLKLTTRGIGRNGTVEIDGEMRNDVQRVVVNFDCEKYTTATVTFVIDQLDVEADALEQRVFEARPTLEFYRLAVEAEVPGTVAHFHARNRYIGAYWRGVR